MNDGLVAWAKDPAQETEHARRQPRLATVAKECCNMVASECVLRRSKRCIIVSGHRCGWFEKGVLPGLSGRAKDVAASAYSVGMGGTAPEGRRCPDCGSPLPRRTRVCEECRGKRRRAAYREKRRNSASIATVNENGLS